MSAQHGNLPSELRKCPTHPAEIFIASKYGEFWTGECDRCRDEARLARQVALKREARRDEIRARTVERVKGRESEIQSWIADELKKVVSAYRREIKPQLEAEIRSEIHRQAEDAVTAEVDEEIMTELTGTSRVPFEVEKE
jgi:hypothetical protein